MMAYENGICCVGTEQAAGVTDRLENAIDIREDAKRPSWRLHQAEGCQPILQDKPLSVTR